MISTKLKSGEKIEKFKVEHTGVNIKYRRHIYV